MENLTDRQWRNLLTDIQNQRCILLLGPLLPTIKKEDTWLPFRSEITNLLKSQLEEEGVSFDEDHSNDLEYIAQRCLEIPMTKDIHFKDDVKKFYEIYGNEIPEIYLQLAQIPFHIIINTSPDDYIERAIREVRDLEPHFSYYNYHETVNIGDIKISKEKPLIYNLTGSVKSTKSLVLAETQQVTYMKNIIKGDPPIPNSLLEKLKPTSEISHQDLSYVFLGFDYNRWQFKVLLDGLNIDKEAQPISPSQTGFTILRRTVEYYKKRFKVHFVEDNINDFVEKLTMRYSLIPQVDNRNNEEILIKKIVISVFKGEIEDAKEVEKMFSPMIESGKVSVWHQGMITHGDEKEQIKQQLVDADIILPLLSSNYLAAPEIIEFEQSLVQSKKVDSIVIPLLLGPCDYPESVYKDDKILPSNLDPIDSPKWGDKRYALNTILTELKSLIR